MRFAVGDRVLDISVESAGSEGRPMRVRRHWGENGYELESKNGVLFTGYTGSDLVADTPAQRAASAARVAARRAAAVVNRAARRARLVQIAADWRSLDARYEADDAALGRARQELAAGHRADREALEKERHALEIEESYLDPEGVAAHEAESERRAAEAAAWLARARKEYGLDPTPAERFAGQSQRPHS